jgi:hypothetical protein
MPINYNRYPYNWKSVIVPTILRRANFSCEFCGLEHGQKVWSIPVKHTRKGKTVYRRFWLVCDPNLPPNKCKVVTVILTIAHLDHDETNHKVSYDRLKALCQRCHLKYDAKHKAKKRYSRSNEQPTKQPPIGLS